MKKFIFFSAALLLFTAANAEQMQFVTTMSAPVGNFARLDAADPTHVTRVGKDGDSSSGYLNFCNTRSSVGNIIIKGAGAYLNQVNIQNGTTLGSTNTPEYRLGANMSIENGGTVTAGRIMANDVTFKDTNFHKSKVTNTIYGNDISVMGGKTDNMEIASTAKITKGAQNSANLGQTMEWSNQYSKDYDSTGNAKLNTKTYTSFLLKSKSSGDSCTPTKNGKERYSERCVGEDNIYADYRWDYTKCRYIQISKCPDSSDSSGKYTCFTSSTWKTTFDTTFDAGSMDPLPGFGGSNKWNSTPYRTSMVCGSETAHHSGYVTPKKGQEFDCTPGKYYLYSETYVCSRNYTQSGRKIGWSCLKCAKTDDLSKCIVPENFTGQNCSAGSGSGSLDFADQDAFAKP